MTAYAFLFCLLTVLPTLVFAQITRVANTMLTLPAAAPTFGFTTEVALNNLGFNQPIAVVSAPGETNRLFVVEKPGRILIVNNPGSASPTTSVFLDISGPVTDSGEEGLLALAFHPNYATNGYFYVWYTLSTTTAAGSGLHDRLSRFRVSTGNPNVADVSSEVPMISQRDEAGNHNGGEIKFGPDGYLYLSTGDEGGGGDGFQNGQRIDKDFFSSVLRLDVDQIAGSLAPNAHASVHAGTYRIPPDNPFVGATSFNGLAVSPANVRTEIWAIGLRNPFRMSFDSVTGQLWLADVGQGAYEEINIITKGGNYGWNFREGFSAYTGTPPPSAVFTNPVHDYPRSEGQSVTGGLVYRGTALSQLYGAYLFADYSSGRLWSLRYTGTLPAQVQLLTTNGGIAGFGINPGNGDILLANINDGRIRRLVYNSTPTGTPLPTTLTATGAFSNLTTLTPAAGIVAYEPNVNFWSDHAIKRRWFSVPALVNKITFADEGNWTFPTGTVWVKHFDLELTRGNPSTARRLETRFLVKTATGVYGATYKWNPAQTEATLVAEAGENETISINDSGTMRNQIWRYPSRAECLQCHTPVGGQALSFNTAQLNRTVNYSGTNANQLTALASAGYFTTTTVPAPATLRALAPASDTSATLEHRVRSYLAANCISCHQPGGAAQGNWDARIQTPTASTGLINGALINSGGDSANRVIASRDPGHSMLLTRISTRGANQMPPLGSNELDTANIALLTSWINSIGTLSISTQPQSAGVTVGSPATFSVVASGSGTLTYQWRKNSVTISGATASSYTIAAAAAGDAGNYSVVVSDTAGSITSANAVLNLIPAGFDVAGYYARNLDVAAFYGADTYGAWLHFLNYGLKEGRTYDLYFRVDEYVELNLDIKAAFGSDRQAALMHWLTYGRVEGRMGRVPIGFNVDNYLARYPDLQAAFGSISPLSLRNVRVWNHYLDWGVVEGRSDGDFEAYGYLTLYSDLAAAYGNDIEAAALHWYLYGRKEGRRIPGGFDVQGYRSRNPDVVIVFGNDLYGEWLHYRDTGVYEGRQYDELFRVLEYRARYSDIQAAYGNNLTGVLLHWLYYGRNEGRLGRNP